MNEDVKKTEAVGSELNDGLGGGHKLKFQVGDRVKVVADKYAKKCSHRRKIGKTYTILEAVKESRQGDFARDYQEYRLSGKDGGWVCEDEIEAA